METIDVIKSLRTRMPWPVALRMLKDLDLPRAQGWEKTVARLSSKEYRNDKTAESLAEALKQHLLCGEKHVRLYDVDTEMRDAIVAGLLEHKVTPSDFSRRYPVLLQGSELVDVPVAPVLVAIETDRDAVHALFCSIRVVQLREPVSTDDMPESAKGLLEGYDEIVGIRHVRYQAADVVTVSRNQPRIAVLVDYPQGTHMDVVDAAQIRIANAFATLTDMNPFQSPVNLFPLINAMYRAKGEGLVVELAFGTTTASLKHEKMRRRSLCLRDEDYHKGGKAALRAPIEPHRISILWKRPLADGHSMPELSLHTSMATALSGSPVLHSAEIRRCVGQSDYDYVQGRLEHYLQTLAAARAKLGNK